MGLSRSPAQQPRCLTHGDGCLPGTRLPGDKDGPAGDLALTDHLQDHACCPPSCQLPHHALGSLGGGGTVQE